MNNVAMVWSAYQYHCVHGTSCLCTLSASAFIETALHQLDFFLEIFLWSSYSAIAVLSPLIDTVSVSLQNTISCMACMRQLKFSMGIATSVFCNYMHGSPCDLNVNLSYLFFFLSLLCMFVLFWYLYNIYIAYVQITMGYKIMLLRVVGMLSTVSTAGS